MKQETVAILIEKHWNYARLIRDRTLLKRQNW
jgi:hypothetical protein